ncbi:transmembrane anchor protein [Brevundimonas diminuta]|uniref:transmembrane anchor protein n=1 Tax=Brevundimonas TaxID=41275 RepID=UPI000E91F28E|nr:MULTISPECIES: transmembrane anchor protein [Brevundimonas]MBD3571515.1 transmembrane anchor protein [Brevundimonas diminuta]HBY43169.1 transmembrane anchor protein [Brevundimonas sp.]
MYNANRPSKADLPTTGQLLKSTGIAAAVASVLLVTVVLPAEYGVDPTRIGSVFGLTEMGRIKQQLAKEAEADAAADAAAVDAVPVAASPSPVAPAATVPAAAPTATPSVGRTDETVLTLQPDQGAEIKLVMEEGATARFTWTSSGGKINFDTHADRPGVSYHGYGKGSSQREEGVLTAAFTGSHGWFWRNRTGQPVTITLKTSGAYTEIKRVV